MDAAFKASGTRSQRKMLTGKYWGAFFNGIAAVASQCDDPDLLNGMRTEPGYVRYIVARSAVAGGDVPR